MPLSATVNDLSLHVEDMEHCSSHVSGVISLLGEDFSSELTNGNKTLCLPVKGGGM